MLDGYPLTMLASLLAVVKDLCGDDIPGDYNKREPEMD